MVEHAAVNRGVVGSSPTRGGHGRDTELDGIGVFFFAFTAFIMRESCQELRILIYSISQCMDP